MRGISNPTKSDFIHKVDLTVKRLHPQSGFHCDACIASVLRYTAKARPNFRYRHSDKTRAELRFAKMHSKANRKPDFCYNESLASTAGVEPPPYGTPYAVPQVCNANFQDAPHPYSHHKGRLITRVAHIELFLINYTKSLDIKVKSRYNCITKKSRNIPF